MIKRLFLLLILSSNISFLYSMQTKKMGLLDLPGDCILQIIFFGLGEKPARALCIFALLSRQSHEEIYKKIIEEKVLQKIMPGLKKMPFMSIPWPARAMLVKSFESRNGLTCEKIKKYLDLRSLFAVQDLIEGRKEKDNKKDGEIIDCMIKSVIGKIKEEKAIPLPSLYMSYRLPGAIQGEGINKNFVTYMQKRGYLTVEYLFPAIWFMKNKNEITKIFLCEQIIKEFDRMKGALEIISIVISGKMWKKRGYDVKGNYNKIDKAIKVAYKLSLDYKPDTIKGVGANIIESLLALVKKNNEVSRELRVRK